MKTDTLTSEYFIKVCESCAFAIILGDINHSSNNFEDIAAERLLSNVGGIHMKCLIQTQGYTPFGHGQHFWKALFRSVLAVRNPDMDFGCMDLDLGDMIFGP